jgi:hypothetical protein
LNSDIYTKSWEGNCRRRFILKAFNLDIFYYYISLGKKVRSNRKGVKSRGRKFMEESKKFQSII